MYNKKIGGDYMIQLKPCPKCGGKAKLLRGLPNMGNSRARYALVICLRCGHKTDTIIPEARESDKSLRRRASELWNNESR